MSITDILKMMRSSFCVIAVGVMASSTVFCYIFFPDERFGLDMFLKIFLMAFLATLPYLVFYSKQELSKSQMLVRHILHFIILISILMYCATRWEWIAVTKFSEVAVYIVCVLIVYVIVMYINYQRDKHIAEEMNEKLNQFHRESDEG